MANSRSDANQVSVRLATSNVDGVTTFNIQANPSTHELDIADGSSGSDVGGAPAKRDGNGITAILAVSSSDGVTPVPVYIDQATRKLLVKST